MATDLCLSSTMSAEDRAEAVEALASGKSVTIGGCSIHPDETSIWGTDCYGIDSFMADEVSLQAAEIAVEWAIRENQRDDHPAERSY